MDYGSGNLRSAQRAFEQSGEEVILTQDRTIAANASGLVVPGVGAFGACMAGLRRIAGDEIVRERISAERPVLGICVGMQILFDHGDELSAGTAHDGIGALPGTVTKLDAPVLPHMGWNTVDVGGNSRLFRGVETESFYFVHSYGLTEASINRRVDEKRELQAEHSIKSWTTYGQRFLSAIEAGYISATQFHPEKSGAAGLALIKNWVSTL